MEWYRREDAARIRCTGIDEIWLLPCGAPAKDLRSLAANSQEEVEGKQRGGVGLLIGTGRNRNGQGLKRDLSSREFTARALLRRG
jgi:hypothetical protein